jgi:quercetin dioxygenase-like cupin family protein
MTSKPISSDVTHSVASPQTRAFAEEYTLEATPQNAEHGNLSNRKARPVFKHPTRAEELTGHNVVKIAPREGLNIQIGNVRVTWKARGEQTGFHFATYECELQPGAGVPLHKHPFAESFYVLQGQLDFGRLNEQGRQEWLACDAGDSVVAPPNAPHAILNRSDSPARFLSTSTYQHELLLTLGGAEVDIAAPLPAEPDPDDFRHFEAVARPFQGYWVHLADLG